MKARIEMCFVISTLLFIRISSSGQDVKVILTGNTADFKNPEMFIAKMEDQCSTMTMPTLWILNGDIFPEMIDDKSISLWLVHVNKLLNQFPLLSIMVTQGDRDWENSGKAGWAKIKSLENSIANLRHERFHVFIGKGCPGPWTFDFNSQIKIVVINSQWWNHPYRKPTPADASCAYTSTEIFMEELENILDESNDKNILVVSHLPLESLGNYGGRFSLSAHLFPPIVGSALVGYHQNVGTPSDIHNPMFTSFRHSLGGLLDNYSSLILASGHERNLSIVKTTGQNFYINSGAPAYGSFAAKSKAAMLTTS